MRKIFLGVLIVCLSLGLAAGAMAVPVIDWSAGVDFNVTGTSGGNDSGLFGGCANIAATATQSYGPFDGSVTFKFDSGECPVAFIDGAFIRYNAAAFNVTMQPLGIDNGLFDVRNFAEDGLGIPSNPGLKINVPMEGFDLYGIVNNQIGSVIYNFAGGVDFTMDALGLGFTFNSRQGAPAGSSYGAQLTYALDAMTFTGQYGGFSPNAGGSGTGYVVKVAYTLPGGSGLCLEYYGCDATLNNDVAPFSKIYGEFNTPLAENVTLTFDVASTDAGAGTPAVTAWEGKIGITL